MAKPSWSAYVGLPFWIPQEREYVEMFRELGSIGALAHSVFNVIDYGAAGDGVTDFAPAFDAAKADVIANGGGTIFIPAQPKGYRTTRQLLLGAKFVNEADVIPGVSDFSTASSFNASAYAQALNYPLISVVAEPGAVLWTDYAPSVDTAALYYGIRSTSLQPNDWHAVIQGLTIIGQAGMTAGVLNSIAGDDPVPGNQMGVFAASTAVCVHGVNVRECKRAGVISGCYWTHQQNLSAWHCIDGWFLNGANASTARNVRARYCKGAGVLVSGQGVKLYGPRTEQCAVDVWAVAGDGVSIADGYLEDIAEAGHTDYAVKWGIKQWQATEQVYAASSTRAATYRWNGGNTYVCIQDGITAGSGGPTGTTSSITDGAAKWAYVAATQNAGVNQVVYGSIYDTHADKQNGGSMLLCGAAVTALNTRMTGVSSVRLDDSGSSLMLVDCGLPIDGTSPGAGNVATLANNSFHSSGGLVAGSDSVTGLTDGSGQTGLTIGLSRLWFDSTKGTWRIKRGQPASAADGVGVLPNSSQFSVNFGSIAAGASGSTLINWSGFALGDIVVGVAWVSVAPVDGVVLSGQVISATQVRLTARNDTAGAWAQGAFTVNVAIQRQLS